MNRARISVIIPAYNSEKYIGKSIESVQTQLFQNWELIVVDDGSKDNTFNVAESYANLDNRIRVIHQKNAGPGIARNTGIAAANGDYIVFFDSDDYVEKDYFQLLSEHDEDVVFINVRNVDEQGHILNEKYMTKNRRLSKDVILRRQMTGRIDCGGKKGS